MNMLHTSAQAFGHPSGMCKITYILCEGHHSAEPIRARPVPSCITEYILDLDTMLSKPHLRHRSVAGESSSNLQTRVILARGS